MKHHTALFDLLLVALLLISCGGRLKGMVGYDHERDFGEVTRIGFWEDANPLARGQNETRRIVRRKIEENLAGRGIGITTPEQGQLLLIYHVGRRAKARVSGMIGGRGTEASLAIEFRDSQTQRTAWYGTVEQSWEGREDVEERIATAVELLLNSFPPASGSGGRIKE